MARRLFPAVPKLLTDEQIGATWPLEQPGTADMAQHRYTASKSPTKDGTAWVISFRHPLRKDPRGKQGRKVGRGLGTSDEARAQALVDEMNILLGNPAWHSIAKRTDAERRFDALIVRAFYDDIENPAFNTWEVRNEALPLPTAEDRYAKALLVGTTGVGKTSLLRHLMGSHPERDRFPSTSASRTTICDIEVVTAAAAPYRAVVTFFNEWTVHTNVHECVADACAALWDDLSDDKLAERLLTHRDLRFRLGYIVGSWGQTPFVGAKPDDDWDYDPESRDEAEAPEKSDGALPSADDIARMQDMLTTWLTRIRKLSAQAKESAQADLDEKFSRLTGPDKEAAQDIFEEHVQTLPDFDELVNDIMDEIRLRFGEISSGLRRHPSGWPLAWEYTSDDRETFVSTIRRFSSNYAPAFGTLLTPLVDGIRVSGPFCPAFAEHRPRLVLIDGEGLGHVGDPAAGVASRISRRFGDVDVILLVDSAKAPMLEAPASVLRAVAASGHQKKLALAFTHFDLVRGQANLPTFAAQRAHVLSSVYQKLASLREVVGVPAVRAIERVLDERCFMLGFLDRPLTEKNRGPVAEMSSLVAFCQGAIARAAVPQASPVYDTAGLVLAIQAATFDFHARWKSILGFQPSSNVRTAHWAEIKALNRRVVLDIDNSEYKDLKPVADFVARLSESVTKFLDRPIRWKPATPSEAEADEALSRVQREVFARLHGFVDEKLLRIPRQQWMEAFDYRGPRSTFRRAKVIQTIYDSSAPVPGPALDPDSEQFLREVRLLVHDAIREGGSELVCDVLGQTSGIPAKQAAVT